MLLLMHILTYCVQHAALTALEIGWRLCSRARSVVCDRAALSCEGSPGHVHSCCRLQLIQNTRFFRASRQTNNREHVKLLSVALVQDAYPLRVELAR